MKETNKKPVRRGTCRAGQENNRVLDERGLCSICAFKIDTADKEAEDIDEIRKEMRQCGIPIARKSYFSKE